MERRLLITIAVVFVVLLAGCSGLGPSESPSETTEDTSTTEQTTAMTTTTTTTTTPTTTTSTTTTPTESWLEPAPPNTPLQNKMGSDARGRIKSVAVVNKTEVSGSGNSNFDLTITADTQMENVDPADHGDEVGEPYFLIYVNGSLDNGSRFSYTNGTLAERVNVSQEKNGEYTIDVRPEALDNANIEEGEVDVLILLMDKDSDWDDIYGVRTVTVEYSAKE